MATLLRAKNHYYTQFYNKNRKPQRKRVALKTTRREVAKKLHRQLEDAYLVGEFDPWTGYRKNGNRAGLHKHSTISEALDAYIEIKSREDWRVNTRKNTEYVLRDFSRFAGEDSSIQSMTPNLINEFLNRDKYAYATKGSHKKKIKPFASWLKKKGLVAYDFSLVKVFNKDLEQKETISYLTESEINRLKEGIRKKVTEDLEKGYQSESRNALWLIDFIDWQRYSGMRLSETLSITPASFNTDTWELTIGSKHFRTKAKAKQILPINEVEVLKEIATKLIAKCGHPSERLFQHKCRNRTSRTFKKYVRLFLPSREDVNVHTLRHTCCIELLRRGVPIYTVQRWMRHSNIRTTQNYADLLGSDISKAVGKALNK